jgi:hypothetical protein
MTRAVTDLNSGQYCFMPAQFCSEPLPGLTQQWKIYPAFLGTVLAVLLNHFAFSRDRDLDVVKVLFSFARMT